MITRRAFFLASTLFAIACSSGTSSNETVQSLDRLTVAITAATLGDECANAKQASGFAEPTDCAPLRDAGSPGAVGDVGCGGSICRNGNLQFTVSLTGSESVELDVVKAVLYDEATNVELDTLEASVPTAWNGSTYVAWNEVVGSGAPVKASYRLSSPTWSSLGGRVASTSAQKYYLLVTFASGGKQVILRSGTLTREPDVAT